MYQIIKNAQQTARTGCMLRLLEKLIGEDIHVIYLRNAIQNLLAGIKSLYCVQCPKTKLYYTIEVNYDTLHKLVQYTADIYKSELPLDTWFERSFQLHFID